MKNPTTAKNMAALDFKKPSGQPSGTKAYADAQAKPSADKWKRPNA